MALMYSEMLKKEDSQEPDHGDFDDECIWLPFAVTYVYECMYVGYDSNA